jgi:hypothetical protein
MTLVITRTRGTWYVANECGNPLALALFRSPKGKATTISRGIGPRLSRVENSARQRSISVEGILNGMNSQWRPLRAKQY